MPNPHDSPHRSEEDNDDDALRGANRGADPVPTPSREEFDRLAVRMDRMTDMFTQLMTVFAVNDMRLPNIPGWPPSNRGANSNQNDGQAATHTPPPNGAGFNAAAGSIAQLVQHPPPSNQGQPLPTVAAIVTPTRNGVNSGIAPPASNNAATAQTLPVSGPAHINPTPILPLGNLHTNPVATLPPDFQHANPIPQPVDTGRHQSPGSTTDGAHSTRSSRRSTRRRAEGRRHHRLPSTDDETGDYAYNQLRPETNTCREIKIEHFSPDNKELDFAIWVNQYEEAVNRSLNPHSKRRHYICCLKWLPSVLKADAYSIWSRAEHKSTNWDLLKAELETAFEDGSIRSEWKTNLKAYM